MIRPRTALASLSRLALATCLGACAWSASAQSYKVPDQVDKGLSVENKLGAHIPMDTVFTDQDGKRHALGDSFKDGKPKILMLVYFRCPMLCNVTLNTVTKQMKVLDWALGKQYDAITISIDPLEKSDLAHDKKANYLQTYGREGADAGWQWMTGEEKDIKKLADAVGFHYFWNAEQKQYAHPSALFFISPTGVLTRNLSGFAPAPEIKQALFEAADGKIGTFGDQVLLRCFHFDPSTGKLTLRIMYVVRAISAMLVLTVACLIAGLRYLEYKGARRPAKFPTAPVAEIPAALHRGE